MGDPAEWLRQRGWELALRTPAVPERSQRLHRELLHLISFRVLSATCIALRGDTLVRDKQREHLFAAVQRRMKTARQRSCADDYQQKSRDGAPRFVYAFSHIVQIRSRGMWNRLGMSMPVPDEVQTRRKSFIDFALLRLSIRDVGIARSDIRSPGPRGFFDCDGLPLNPSEELSASFRVSLAQLLMASEMFKNSIRKNDNLAGVTQRYPKRHWIPRNEYSRSP